jgi:hypothetical protein
MTSGSGRSFSEQAIATEGPPMVNNMNRLWATTGNLQEHKQDIFGNKLKPVMFSARVHVILVPSITDYESAGLTNDLWWKDDDYTQFKQSALKEVRNFMIEKAITNSKDAIKILYQNMDCDDLERIAKEIDLGITAEQSVLASKLQESIKQQQADNKTEQHTPFEEADRQQQQQQLSSRSEGPVPLELNPVNASQAAQAAPRDEKMEKKKVEKFIFKPEAAINAEMNNIEAGLPHFHRKLNYMVRSHSFSVNSGSKKMISDSEVLNAFHSKTDLDLIHEKCSRGHFPKILHAFHSDGELPSRLQRQQLQQEHQERQQELQHERQTTSSSLEGEQKLQSNNIHNHHQQQQQPQQPVHPLALLCS